MIRGLYRLLIVFAVFFALAMLAIWIEATLNYPKLSIEKEAP